MAMTVDIISTPAISSANAPTLSGKPTMSSREIAALTGKTHKNVIRDIVIMIDAIHKDGSDLSHQAKSIAYVRHKDARGYTSSFDLDQDLTYNLVLGYDAALRLRVVQRWMELESGKGTTITVAPKRPRKPAFDTTYTRLLKIARTLPNTDENQQCMAAARGTFEMTGVNPLELMGMTSLAAPTDDAYLTPTEIGHQIAATPREVNQLLVDQGYQTRHASFSSSSDYRMTEKGAPFVVIALGALIWYANRSGKNAASVSTSEAAKTSADATTLKAQSMAQAQADKPATEDAVLQRLGDGTA